MRSRAVWLMGLGLLLAGCSDPGKELASSDSKARARAIHDLVAKGGDYAAEQLAPLARSEDAAAASQAITALGRVRSDRAVEALNDVAVQEQRAALRHLAVVSLSRQGGPKATDTLRRVIANDPAAPVRAEAAMGLAVVGSMDDVPLLVQVARAETDPVAAAGELTALGTLTGVEFVYDPNEPPEVRRKHIEEACDLAVRFYEMAKGLRPKGF